jgi:hypothetical protein
MHLAIKGRPRKDADYGIKMGQLKQTTKGLYNSLAPIRASVRQIKMAIKDTRQSIMKIYDSLKKAPTSDGKIKLLQTKEQLVVGRKKETKKLNDAYGEMNQIYREVDRVNKEKSMLYNETFGSTLSPASMASSSSSQSSASGYLDDQSTYVGVDPGVKTMASSVAMGSIQAGAYILLANRFSMLEDHLEDKPDAVKWLMNVKARDITAKNISSNARTLHNHHQLLLQKKKDLKAKQAGNNESNSIQAIESRLSNLASKLHGENIEKAMIDQYEYGKGARHTLQLFYHDSAWIKKQKKGRMRFTSKAYSTAAKKNCAETSSSDPETG